MATCAKNKKPLLPFPIAKRIRGIPAVLPIIGARRVHDYETARVTAATITDAAKISEARARTHTQVR